MTRTIYTYSVTMPNGAVRSRKSHHTYTHAVVVLSDPWHAPGTSRWSVLGFCGSLELAVGRRDERLRRCPGDAACVIVETTR